MTLVLSAEQRQAKDVAQRFFGEAARVANLRAVRDRADRLGHDPAVWRGMVELGLPGAAIAEADGGIGLGYAGLGAILEEGGRTLAASPLFASAVLGAAAIDLAGDRTQRAALLPRIAAGELTFTMAADESASHAPHAVATTARRIEDGYVLQGRKAFVPDGGSADRLVVTARDEATDIIALFVVERGSEGLTSAPLEMVDSRNMAHVVLRDVRVELGARLAGGDDAGVLDRILDRARVGIAAELLGHADELFDRTKSYLCEREQFGVKIGSFQGLKHRAARMFVEIELTRSAVRAALAGIDETADETPMLVSLAKARANDTALLVSNEAIQLHGGIGVTDELDIGLFLKRARIAAQLFGNSRYHRARYATLAGY